MFRYSTRILILFLSLSLYGRVSGHFLSKCYLSESLKSEIASYKYVVDKIKRLVVDADGPLKNSTWNTLANFVDDFGPRIAGSQNLENAIDHLLQELEAAKLENVHGENAPVPHWIRGEESATLLKPRKVKLSILGLGSSIGTSKEGITAEVIVVKSFDELHHLSENVKGKIVVYNEEYHSYGETVDYRGKGAAEASKLGAVAVLIRSITPFSINSPHTGAQHYENAVPIPTACITVEHAQLLQRFYNRGIKLEINLKMGARTLPQVISRNVVGEIVGQKSPEEVVIVSGHVDSWDVGQGAMDDGGGAFIAWRSLVVLKTLGLRARRTVRSVLWTSEEQGYWGARSYFKDHINEIKNFVVVMESDEGTFTPTGLDYYGPSKVACILKEVMKLMEPFNATELAINDWPVSSDITLWEAQGVPGISLKNKNENYFWYHHTEADMMTVENTEDLDLCTALWAAVSYIIADISVNLSEISRHKLP